MTHNQRAAERLRMWADDIENDNEGQTHVVVLVAEFIDNQDAEDFDNAEPGDTIRVRSGVSVWAWPTVDTEDIERVLDDGIDRITATPPDGYDDEPDDTTVH